MKSLKTIFIIAILGCIYNVNGQEFKLKKSKLFWTGKAAFSSYSLSGTLETLEGQAIIQNDTITAFSIVIDMKSLNHENQDLKSHLRGSDFFEVKQYETSRFVLNKPTIIDDGKTLLIGNMTIKGTTIEEQIPVTINKETLTLSFDITLDRTTYGVTYNSPSIFKKLKENAIEDSFNLKAELQFQ